MDELLPALDAALGAGPELATALRAALASDIAPVRLAGAPLDYTMHALELRIEGSDEPLVLLAEPAGLSREGLFPLRLHVIDDAQRVRVTEMLRDAERVPAAVEVDTFVGRVIAGGKYRVESQLGAGAVGRVYRAMHLGLSRVVAVKVLHPFFAHAPDFLARFHDEALTASRLDHANVTRVLDFGQETDGTLYLVMEYLEGAPLEDVLAREGPLDPDRAVNLMMQVCAGLGAAHEAGVVHRDIKPENIVVSAGRDDDGTPIEVVKVCDFGIAQLQEEGRPGSVGQICGTPAYMSPEQGRGEFLDARSDVYGCGVTLFQLLTGRVPFEAVELRDMLVQHASELPRRPSELRSQVGLRLDRIVLKCLAKERDDRYPSARELRAALQGLEEPHSSQPAPELEEFVSLDDPRSGFARFVTALGGMLFESDRSGARALVEAATQTLRYCGELTLARGPDDGPLVVVTGAGEMSPLKDLAPAELRPIIPRIDARFRHSQVSALTMRTGIDESSLSVLQPLLLRSPARSPRATTAVSLLKNEELLGHGLGLPWIVQLVISRVAHDLSMVWAAGAADLTNKREWRSRIVREALRSVDSPGPLLAVLDHGPLVENAVGAALEDRSFAEHVLEVLPWSRSHALADLLLSDVPLTVTTRVVHALGARIAHEQSSEAEALLRDMRAKRVLSWADLPLEAQDWLRGSEGAALLSRAPQTILAGLDLIDDAAYIRELGWIKHALPLVVRRGDATAGRAVFTMLSRHRRQHAEPQRQARIAETLAVYSRPDVLRALAETLLYGEPTQRESARLLLTGMEGAIETILRVATSLRPGGRIPSLRSRTSVRIGGR